LTANDSSNLQHAAMPYINGQSNGCLI